MKKLLAFLLVASMIVAMFAIPAAAAEDTVNYEEEFKFTKKAPKVDGKVTSGEYGTLPIHTYPEDKNQFVDNEHNDYAESDWAFEFHGVWDAEYIYMAWVINTDVHVGIPEKDFNGNNSWGEEDYGYMWMYSCVQFIFTPGAPSKGETLYQSQQYGGDYLEVGLALTAENNPIRIAWSKPVNSAALNVNEWDAAIVRDDANKTTTYEVKIPWNKSGINQVGDGAQFGLTYAVAAQEYEVKRGMIEWQNGVLSSKDADSAAVITLTGNKDIEISDIVQEASKENGTLPADAEGAVQMIIDGVNTSITGEKAYLYTDPSKISENNNNFAACLLLKPVDGGYEVVETKVGTGDPFSFDSEIEDGMIAFAAHSDGTGVGNARRDAVMSIGVGDKLSIFGVDFEKADTTYLNAMLYKPATTTEGDTSEGETSEDASEGETSEDASEGETSADASEGTTSESTDTTTSESTTSTATSDADNADEEGGLGIWLWVIIGVVVLAGVAVVVIVISKKK